MKVDWIKCSNGNVWCLLNSVDLTDTCFDNLIGVYVIWHGGNPPITVKIGQGDIRDRFTAHRNDQSIQKYDNLGLFVTWAEVDANSLDGVEKFLGDELQPLVGTRFPNVTAIQVNLPE